MVFRNLITEAAATVETFMRVAGYTFALLLLGAVGARAQDDHVSTRSTSAVLIPVDGPTVPGTIEVGGDRDWFRVTLSAGQSYFVYTTALGGGMDSVISVYTPRNSLVGTDDDGGGAGASRLTFVAPATGTYHVRLVHQRSTGTGTYEIGASTTGGSTSPVPVAPTNVVATALSTVRAELTWTDASTDEDAFTVERRLRGQVTYTTRATLPAGTTSWIDTGLTEGRTYEYRVFAGNAAGRSGSAVATVTTYPIAPSNLAGVAASHRRVDLTWTDRSSGEDGFEVERRAPGGAFARVGVVGANATAFADGAVTEGAAFEYRVFAFNVTGGRPSTIVRVDTPVAPPSDLRATPIDPTTIALTWTDESANETGYRVEWRDPALGAFVPLATLGPDATSFTAAGLAANATHHFKVVPLWTGGDGEARAVTGATILLEAPIDCLARAFTPADVQLTWRDRSTRETGFRVERRAATFASGPQPGTGPFTVVGAAPQDASRFVDAGVAPGVWEYRVVATDGTFDSPPAQAFVSVWLEGPSRVTAMALSPTEVRVAWTDASASETGFRVERRQPPRSFGVVGATGPDVTSFTDTTLTPGETYEYRVQALGPVTGRDSPRSDAVTVVMPTAPFTGTPALPPAPSALTAQAIGPNTIELTWTDHAGDELGFRIERQVPLPGSFTPFVPVGAAPADVTSFRDGSVTPGRLHEYRVVAVGAAGHSLPSDVAGATTTALSGPTDLHARVVASGWVELRWQDQATTETGFEVDRRARGVAAWTPVGAVGADVTTWVDTTAAGPADVEYQVRAVTTGGTSGPSNWIWVQVPAAPPPVAPSALRAVATSPLRVDLTWTDHAADETGFRVERRAGPGPFRTIATLAANVVAYSDAGALPGRTYEYRVAAETAGGPSRSEAVRVTTPRGGPLVNGDFEAGDARGWSVLAGAVGPVRLHDVNGDGVATLALPVLADGTQLSQAVELASGTLELSVDYAGRGWLSLLFDGVLVAHRGDEPAPGVKRLRATLPAVAPGLHEVRLVADESRGWELLLDDVVLSGSAVPAPPTAPGTLGVTAASAGRIDLAWVDTSSDETGFRLERSPVGGAGFAEVGRVAAGVTTFADATAQAGRAYEYRVVATNAGGDSRPSNVASSPLPSRPSSPGSLVGSTSGAALATLTWTDRSTNETGFLIERRLAGAWYYAQVGLAAPNATSFSDLSATPSTAYDYRVIAVNDAGESSAARVSLTTGAPLPAPGAATALTATYAATAGVVLVWSPGATADAGVRIDRKVAGGWFTLLDVTAPGALTYVDPTPAPDNEWIYRVVRLGAGGLSPGVEATLRVGARPPLPATEARATARGPFRALLTWADGGDDETGYRVERSAHGAGAFAPVATLPADATAWLDEDLQPGASVEYRVVAVRERADAPAAWTAATAPPSGQPVNGSFDTRDLRGWTAFGPSQAGLAQAEVQDVDGDGRASWVATLYRVGHSTDVGLRQDLELVAGSLDLSVGVLLRQGHNGSRGLVSLVLDGVVVATHDFDATPGSVEERAVLQASVPAVTAGVHELRLVAHRSMGASDGTPRYSFDDLRLSGSAVPSLPVAPTGLAAARTSAGVRLTWTDASSDERGFRVERSAPGGGSFVEVGRTAAGATTFTDTTALAGVAHEYRVFATNESGDSAASDVAAAP